MFFVLDELLVLQGGKLDGGPDHIPPDFEPGGLGGTLVFRLTTTWVAEQDGIERSQDLAAVVIGPFYRVGMLEGPVFRVDAVDAEADHQGPGGEIAARRDIVAGEEKDRVGRDGLGAGDAEYAV